MEQDPNEGEVIQQWPVRADEKPGFTSLRVLKFARAYVETGNAMEAARRAGYTASEDSLRKVASRLLQRDDVGLYVSKHLSALMAPEEAGAILSELSRADMSNFIDIDEDGQPQLNLNKAEAQINMRQIQKLKPTKFGWEISLHSPMEPLKLYFMYADQADKRRLQRRTVEGLLETLSPEMRDRVRAELAGDGEAIILDDAAPESGPEAKANGPVDLSWLRPVPEGFPVEAADETPEAGE